jgi:DUF1009 family protein
MTLALIAGAGALPAALVQALPTRPFIAAMDGFPPDGLPPDLTFRIERLYPFFNALQDAGVTEIAFAGAVRRPRLDPALFDQQTAQIVPRLMHTLAQGDDATLREVIALFEEEGFTITGAAEIAPSLTPPEGLYAGALTPRDQQDATRAAAIAEALGRVDVGQGCVVAQGICLATETIAGTDRRIDLPTLGPATVEAAAAAGLAGIAWEAGATITLDLPAMQETAAQHGLYLWSRAPSRS